MWPGTSGRVLILLKLMGDGAPSSSALLDVLMLLEVVVLLAAELSLQALLEAVVQPR